MKRPLLLAGILFCLVMGTAVAQAWTTKGPAPEVFLSQLTGHNAWLGVQVRDLNSDELQKMNQSNQLGVWVVEVVKDSPAAKAGLTAGDIIQHFAGIPVLGSNQFVSLIGSASPGRRYALEVLRNGKPLNLSTTLEKRPARMAPEMKIPRVEIPRIEIPRNRYRFFSSEDRPRLGIYYEDLTEQLGKFLGVTDGKGVLVTSVVKDSPAEKGGLQAGDVIVKIGDARIADSGDLIEALADIDRGAPVSIDVVRRGKPLTITVTLEKKESRSDKRVRYVIQ